MNDVANRRRELVFENQPRLADLEKILLKIGGNSVCFPMDEEDLSSLLKRGQDISGPPVEEWDGQPNQCHANSGCFWDHFKKKRPKIRIMTGYALSDDLWRQHTWCLDEDETGGNVIWESTGERDKYFGFIMSPAECETFVYENL